MSYRYSPSANAFYPPDIEYPALPDDLVQISDDAHAALHAGQGLGYRIVAGEDGVPELAARPPAPPIRRIAPLAFRRRLSDAKRATIASAAAIAALQGDGTLAAFDADLAASRFVDLDDPRVVAGVALLEGRGLITAAEATALRADGTAEERA